jgi:hypothetical protein
MWHPLSAKKLALTSLTSGGCSVGIVRLRTEATELLVLIGLHLKVYSRVGEMASDKEENKRGLRHHTECGQEEWRVPFRTRDEQDQNFVRAERS